MLYDAGDRAASVDSVGAACVGLSGQVGTVVLTQASMHVAPEPAAAAVGDELRILSRPSCGVSAALELIR